MKSFIFFALLILMSNLVTGQNIKLDWVQSFGSTGAEAGNCVKTDSKANILTLGYFRGSIDFDSGIEELSLKSNGSTDIFLCKMNSEGKLMWARNFGGRQQDQGITMAIDQQDNIYIAGTFQESIDFNLFLPGVKITAQAFNDIFIAKLNSDGNLLWVKALNGSLDDIAKSIALDSENNILLCGYFQGTITPEINSSQFNYQSKGGDDVLILKMDSLGNFIWSKHVGGRLDDDPLGVAVDANNDIVICGIFNDTIDIDPGTSRLLFKEKGTVDAFILKLNSQGEYLWAIQQSSEEFLNAISVAVDNSNNIIITGTFRTKADFDPGIGEFIMTSPGVSGDSYIQKLDSKGNFIWAIQFGADRNENSIGLSLDKHGNIYTTGCYQFKVDFDPGPNEFFLYSDGENNNDIYVSSIDPDGRFRWAYGMNGPASDIGFSVAVDKNLGVYSTGIFGKTLNVGFNPDSVKLNSNGFEDIFLHKISQLTSKIQDHYNDYFIVYPNPLSDNLKIYIDKDQSIHRIAINNVNGKKVYEKVYHKKEYTNFITLSDLVLPSGFYLIEVNSEKKLYSSSIQILR